MVLLAARGGRARCCALPGRAFGGLPRLQPLVGLIVILAIAYALSTNRRAIDRRTVAWGLALQIVLRAARAQDHASASAVFQTLGGAINRLLDFAFVGSSVRVRPARRQGGVAADHDRRCSAPEGAQYGVIFAFQVLPTIIFIAALFAILYYFGVMQLVVRLFAVVMRRVMRASAAPSR